jgi:hypothetical protein
LNPLAYKETLNEMAPDRYEVEVSDSDSCDLLILEPGPEIDPGNGTETEPGNETDP